MPSEEMEMLDVVVVLRAERAEPFADSVARLRDAGLKIDRADEADGVVEGSVDAEKLPDIQKLDCVSYARVDFEYIAEPPEQAEKEESSGDEDE